MTPILDWRSRHDEKSRDYAVRNLFVGVVAPQTKLWTEGTVLDQGNEGACVGFGNTGYMLTSPQGGRPRASAANKYAMGIYKDAQKIDPWPGEEYSGTSVLAGAQTLKARGLISSYHWAFSVQDVRDALVTTGPVVIGIPWHDGMYDTRPDGLVDVSGPVVGGHCILLSGYYRSKTFDRKPYEVVRWRNSWGTSYGVGGSAYIKLDDLAGLLAKDGEACIPVGKRKLTL